MDGDKKNTLNVRLDASTNKKLAAYSQQHETSKSSIVKEALAMYFTKEQSKQYPHALGIDLFGAGKSDKSNNSTSYKSQLKKKLHEKYAH